MIIQRNILFGLILYCGTGIAAEGIPSHCKDFEQIVFSCKIDHSSKVLSLCASQRLTNKVGYLQYRFGVPGKVELEFPKEKQASQTRFLYAHYFRYQVERVQISFKNKNHEYSVFDFYDGTEKPPRMSGVTVGQAELYCGEPISSQLSILKEVIPCDEENALNMNGCN